MFQVNGDTNPSGAGVNSNRQKICRVCSDKAMGFNFNAVTCESCKAFFRRNAFKTEKLRCPFDSDCIIDKSNRRFCQKCRLQKCLQVGMKREWILSEEQKKLKRAKIVENRMKRDSISSEDQHADDKPISLTNKKGNFSTLNDHLPATPSSTFSISSSSSSQDGDEPGSAKAYNFLGNPSLRAISPSRKESVSNSDNDSSVLLGAITPSSPVTSTLPSVSTLGCTQPASNGNGNIFTIDNSIGASEKYFYRPSLSFNDQSLNRDLFETSLAFLINESSSSHEQNFLNHRASSIPNHHSVTNLSSNYLNNNPENLTASIEYLPRPPTSIFLSTLTSPDTSTQLEPMNHNPTGNHRDFEEREGSRGNRVNHRILEVNLAPLYLRNDPQGSILLNDLETSKINELIQAFSAIDEPILDQSCAEDSGIFDVIRFSDLAIRRLIKWCKRINAFSSLCLEDQMALLKGGCLEMLSMKASYNFNIDDESWQDSYTKNGLKLTIFRQASEKLYEAHRQFIKTFNQRWRTDHKVNLLLVVIVLFNPERPNLQYPATVRLEHYTYIYLLRRYLETKSDSLCQARTDHYNLMMKIEDLRELHKKTIRLYSDAGPEVVGPLLIEILDLK